MFMMNSSENLNEMHLIFTVKGHIQAFFFFMHFIICIPAQVWLSFETKTKQENKAVIFRLSVISLFHTGQV